MCFCEIGFEYVIVDSLATCLSSLVPSPLLPLPFFPAQWQKWAGNETSVCHMSNKMAATDIATLCCHLHQRDNSARPSWGCKPNYKTIPLILHACFINPFI